MAAAHDVLKRENAVTGWLNVKEAAE
jgi:hypothetical protein